MNRQAFGIRKSARLACLAAVIGLGGCAEIGAFGSADGADRATPANQGVLRVDERDVERPDIFETEATGLWDGRFSLGGRWVAVPGNVEADRVRITNLGTGRVVEGALFRREVELPGPPITVSMDAAEALGMQAGSPAELRVVAIRSETVEVRAPAAPEGDTEPEAGTQAEAALPTAEVETTELAATTQDPAPDSAPAAGASAQPRIQVASGANREGAEAVVRRLSGESIPASVAASGTEEQPFYRVIAGPFPDMESLNAALAMLRSIGYADAFAVN